MKNLKKMGKKIGKWIKENPLAVVVIILSIALLLVGGKILASRRKLKLILFAAVIFLDFLYFLPSIYRLITHKKKKKKTKKEKKIIWKRIFIILFSLGIMGLLAICFFFFLIVKNAPDFDPERLYKKESSIIYDKDGNIIAKIGSEKRENITYEEMPEVLVDAIIATEDARFFQHNGFDLPRFSVAFIKQLLGNSSAGGASTLTMQLNKNNYTSTVSSGWDGIVRKFTDIYMAIFKIEKQYTKKEILEFYANSNYLGSGAYGVEQASLTYFGKNAKDLNLSEAALIAGLFNAPTYYDPYQNPEEAESRRLVVLSLMERHGYITREEREIAKKLTVEKILKKTSDTEIEKYQSFINNVTKEVLKNTGNNPYEVSMEIYTTMNASIQEHVDNLFAGTGDYEWENDKVQAATVVLDVDTGAIVAIASGRNRNSAFGYSYATDATRQIGSTAKPFYDYGPGIEFENWSTYTPFTDEPHAYSDGTKISNWNRTYEGFRTLHEALRVSRNIPALKAFQANKNANIKTFVTNLGLSPEIDANGKLHEAHALGGYNAENPLSMAAAYAAFANGGYYNKPYSVSKIVYRETGDVWEYKGKKTKAMSEETAYMINRVLKDAGQYGLGSWRYINGAEYFAKTGTSNYDSQIIEMHNYPSNAVNDLWLNGANPKYAISVWYGYEEAIDGYVSTTNTSKQRQLWAKIAEACFESGLSFKKAENVIEVEVELESYPAALPSEYTPAEKRVTEYFKKGTEPTEVSKRFQAADDPTALNATYKNSTITLSWQASNAPWALDTNNVQELGNQLFGDEEQRNAFISRYLEYTASVVGDPIYKIYEKQSDGSLQALGSTKDTSFSISITSTSEPKTYIVKSGYTNIGAESTGAEVTYKFDSTDSIITSELQGNKEMTLTIGDTFQDPSVKVFDNLVDVTDKATITVAIVRASDKQIVTKIETDSEETYTMTYLVKYKDFEDSYIRTVIIKADAEENNEGED